MDLYAAEEAAGNNNLFGEHWLTGLCKGRKQVQRLKNNECVISYKGIVQP